MGKTEVAKVLARWTGAELVRLQCYEGIDAAQALYEWDYPRQLLHLRATEASGAPVDEDELYTERFLVRRPLLRALDHAGTPPVLLIDEVDRADDEFEAFLLELLSDYSVTIPELGVIRAETPPVVILTSNRTRDVHDALKRRCLYHWIDHPDFEREVAIVERKAPGVGGPLAREVAGAAEVLRVARPLQAARGRGDDRLGHRARSPRRRASRRVVGRGHARRGPQVPRGPGPAPRPRARGDGRGGRRAKRATARVTRTSASGPERPGPQGRERGRRCLTADAFARRAPRSASPGCCAPRGCGSRPAAP